MDCDAHWKKNNMATPLRFDMILPNGQPLRLDTPGARLGGTVEEVMAAINAQNNTNMNNNNRIIATIAPADQTAALAHYAGLQTLMPFMRAMTADEKKTINDAANGRLPFTQQACQYAQQHPEVLAGTFSLPAMIQTTAFLTAFVAIYNADASNHEKIVDTFRLANSDGYNEALKIYNYFKAANTNGDYNDVVANLGSYFKGQGKKKTPPTTPPAAPTP
jgi:cytochrome bd-type quinol oxidase subunit 1